MMDAVTKEGIRAKIVGVHYNKLPNSTVTICRLQMQNGFSAIGKSACVRPEIFNALVGENIAYEDAFDQLWELEGYLLAEARYKATQQN